MSIPSTEKYNELQKYSELTKNIQNTIKSNDELYKSIATGEYQDTDQFQTTLSEFKIDAPTSTTLEKTRDELWDYMTKQYNEHTKMRKFYFDEIKKEASYLEELKKEESEIEGSLTDANVEDNTMITKIKQEKYKIASMSYYFDMYKYLIILELLIILVLAGGTIGLMPKLTVIVLCILLCIIGAGLVYYYVYYNNMGRDKFVWEKREFPDTGENGSVQCISNYKTKEQNKKDKIDNDIQKFVKA